MKRFFLLLTYLILFVAFVACKKEHTVGENPLLEQQWDTPYGVPPFDRIEFEHYAPAFDAALSAHNEQIAAIVESKQEPTFENVILAYDNSGIMLSKVRNIFELLAAADTDEQMQGFASEIMPRLAAHYDAILMNDKLFEKIKSVYDSRHAVQLDAEQLRLTEKIYRSFVRSGALLGEEQKSRLKQINEQLTTLSVDFGRNLLAETNDYKLELDDKALLGVPLQAREMAEDYARSIDEGGKMIFTLQKPSFMPVLTYARDRAVREQIFKAYISRCNNQTPSDNKAIVAKMASLRYEKAQLLGYDSYAHYVTDDEMASTPEAVYALLDQVWEPALEVAKSELEQLKVDFHRENGNDKVFEAWDWWYYAEKLRQSEYKLKEEDVREYLSLDNVKGGIFFLCNRLYGITLRPLKAPLYHPDCEAYEVLDNDDTPLGVLYMDFHPRQGKSSGAWCGSFIEQSYEDGKRVVPVVSIVCNFTPPAGGVPSLLSIDETETLFHEFGHALHALFSDVKYRGLSAVEGDFVELPSQIMENWAFTPQLLKQYAVHYRRGDVMPNDMIENIRRSSKFNEGFNTTELLAAAYIDMDIHSLQSAEQIDVVAFEREALTQKRGLIPQIEPRYHYPYFSHIFDGGYSAGYYFYVWAEVLDKDAYQAFVESGDILDRTTAERFRREILSRGGEREGMQMYRAFRGADPDNRAMLVARGLVEPEQQDSVESVKEVVRVDTRRMARERAQRSREEREAARLKADSLEALRADSLAALNIDTTKVDSL
jgi:peptidyl-dipeptidase Dcp